MHGLSGRAHRIGTCALGTLAQASLADAHIVLSTDPVRHAPGVTSGGAYNSVEVTMLPGERCRAAALLDARPMVRRRPGVSRHPARVGGACLQSRDAWRDVRGRHQTGTRGTRRARSISPAARRASARAADCHPDRLIGAILDLLAAMGVAILFAFTAITALVVLRDIEYQRLEAESAASSVSRNTVSRSEVVLRLPWHRCCRCPMMTSPCAVPMKLLKGAHHGPR